MEWTIGELAERASTALASTARLNGRVRDVPNERLIRWYSTIGLLDPPSARRGRIALYGRRHLLQLIAVKRRQADGRTIAEIQAELTGAADQVLESIADIPETSAETSVTRAPRPRFWAEPPSGATTPLPLTTAPPSDPAGSPSDVATPLSASPAAPPASAAPPSAPAGPPSVAPAAIEEHWPPASSATVIHGVRLTAGVTVLLDGGGRAPSPDDLAEITAASEALLSVLRERGLTSPEREQS